MLVAQSHTSSQRVGGSAVGGEKSIAQATGAQWCIQNMEESLLSKLVQGKLYQNGSICGTKGALH